MVSINFQPDFADAIELGLKTQTIRQKARCKVGDRLQLYTGQRTKRCRKILDAYCTDVEFVRIYESGLSRNHAHICATSQEADMFAKADGFDNFPSFQDFFRTQYGLPFEGYLIKWRNQPLHKYICRAEITIIENPVFELYAKDDDEASLIAFDLLSTDYNAAEIISAPTERIKS